MATCPNLVLVDIEDPGYPPMGYHGNSFIRRPIEGEFE